MGFEGKPKEIKEDIMAAAQGSEEAKARLSVAGKKGAEKRAINKEVKEYYADEERERLIASEIERIKSDSASEEMTDLEIREDAEKVVNAILAMRKRQKEMEKSRGAYAVSSQEGEDGVDAVEDLKKQVEEGNDYAKEALDILDKE